MFCAETEMYTEKKDQKKIIAAKSIFSTSCLARTIFSIVFFCLECIFFGSLGFSQTESNNADGYIINNKISKIFSQKPQPEAKFSREYHTKNMGQLTFKPFPFKPVYSGIISEEESKNTREANNIILQNSESCNPFKKKLSGTKSKNTTFETKITNNNVRGIYVIKSQPEAKFRRVYHSKNLAPLSFKIFPFKPVYSGVIVEEDLKESKKAKTMIRENSKSSNPMTKKLSAFQFNINEQKQKDRENQMRVMLEYNNRNKQKLRENFEKFQKLRSHAGKYSGLRYDYTSYNKKFQVTASR